MFWRNALLALSAAATGLQMGRQAVRKVVAEESAAAKRAAIAEARERIRSEAQRLANELLLRFAISTGLKAAIIFALWAVQHYELISSTVFIVAFGAVVALFFIRDLYIAWPALRVIGRELRGSGWRPREALADFAARQVETEAHSRASAEAAELGWLERVALAIAGSSRADIAAEVADATAAAVRETTWRDVRPLMLATFAKISIGFAVYAAFATLLAANID
ncbi:MAG: hypothetical protein MRY74_11240 [Neomegalonema sp.]|nr:hypothetical protein [Neomegalonema sp.]